MDDADKKLLKLRTEGTRLEYMVAAANAVPILIAEKDALLKRIAALYNRVSGHTMCTGASPRTRCGYCMGCRNHAALTADDAAAKEGTNG